MSKLKTVIRHEYLTIVRQPSFWIVMLAIPAFIAIAMTLSYFGNKSSADRLKELGTQLKNVAIVDESGILNEEVARSTGQTLSPVSKLNQLKDAVKNGEREALIVYPGDLEKNRKYQVYLSTNDFTKSGSVTSLADTLLETSIFLPLGTGEIIALAKDGAEAQLTTYENGHETAGFNEYLVPGAFMILFYIILFFSVGYMLTSIGEEKENRSMEMVLTYVDARSLIIGKLLAVMFVTLTQILFFALLAGAAIIVAHFIGSNLLSLPAGIDLNRLVFDPTAIFFGASFLIVGFLLFAGYMITTAAAAPSTREANSFSSVFYIGAFAPFYFVMLILTDPENPVTRFVTFFPITSPVVTLLRNTIGNMGLLESSLALVTMTAFMILSLVLAVRTFKRGALEFNSRISLKTLLGRS